MEAYQSRDDRVVAEFGDGYPVDGIAARHGLTVEQVYAVVERDVGPADPDRPPPAYAPPGADDVIVAEYGEGHDVAEIARRHGVSVDRIYEVVHRAVGDDLPPAEPDSSW
jgi:Mor family transcriptional regulator